MDVAYRSLELAKNRLRLDSLPTFVQARIKLIQGSLTYANLTIPGKLLTVVKWSV